MMVMMKKSRRVLSLLVVFLEPVRECSVVVFRTAFRTEQLLLFVSAPVLCCVKIWLTGGGVKLLLWDVQKATTTASVVSYWANQIRHD